MREGGGSRRKVRGSSAEVRGSSRRVRGRNSGERGDNMKVCETTERVRARVVAQWENWSGLTDHSRMTSAFVESLVGVAPHWDNIGRLVYRRS